MGFRIRKTIKSGGFRTNISKSGVGFSFGMKGLRFTQKANGGTRTTVSLPGTGISSINDNSTNMKDDVSSSTYSSEKTNSQKAKTFKEGLIISMVFMGLFVFGSIGMFIEEGLKLEDICFSVVSIILSSVLSLFLYKKWKTYTKLAEKDEKNKNIIKHQLDEIIALSKKCDVYIKEIRLLEQENSNSIPMDEKVTSINAINAINAEIVETNTLLESVNIADLVSANIITKECLAKFEQIEKRLLQLKNRFGLKN